MQKQFAIARSFLNLILISAATEEPIERVYIRDKIGRFAKENQTEIEQKTIKKHEHNLLLGYNH